MTCVPEGLFIERDRLLNAVTHLQRSNRDLQECLDESGNDPELRQALGENIVVIAKYKAKIEQIEQEIRKARGLPTEVPSLQAVPAEDDGPEHGRQGRTQGNGGPTPFDSEMGEADEQGVWL
ncbi:hypothetical protein BSKO_00849 [Bryopsis sp. KO-2023]|nr:hypothetical protein BSKO_00849 [Bryopsis sp. KO-2023]